MDIHNLFNHSLVPGHSNCFQLLNINSAILPNSCQDRLLKVGEFKIQFYFCLCLRIINFDCCVIINLSKINLHKIGQIKKMFTHLNVLTIWKVTQCLIKSSFVVLFKKSEQHERNKQEYILSTEANINQD